MFSDEQIFERLMNGENIDDIMAEITNSVNAAIQKKADADKAAEEAKRKAEEEAKAKAEAKAAEKYCAIRELLDAIANVCDLWGWEETANECDAMTDEDIADIIEAIDSYGNMIITYKQLKNSTFPLGGTKAKVEKKPVEKKADDATEVITKFLKGYGLI